LKERIRFFVNPAGELVYAIGKEINEKFKTMEIPVKELEHKSSGEVIIGEAIQLENISFLNY